MRSNILFYIITFSIGIVAGKLIDWGYFELSKEISIIEALTLFVTVGIGLYIANVLERKIQNNRIEKDLYISKIGELEVHLSKIEEIIENDNISYSKIINQLHHYNSKRNLIFKNINSLKGKKEEINKKKESLNSKNRQLRHLLTSTPRTDSMNPNISLSDGILHYSPNRLTDILTQINSTKDELFRVKTLINNL